MEPIKNLYTGALSPNDHLDKYTLSGPNGKETVYLIASESRVLFEMVPLDSSEPRPTSSHPNYRHDGFKAVPVTDPDIRKGLLKIIFGTPIKRR